MPGHGVPVLPGSEHHLQSGVEHQRRAEMLPAPWHCALTLQYSCFLELQLKSHFHSDPF